MIMCPYGLTFWASFGGFIQVFDNDDDDNHASKKEGYEHVFGYVRVLIKKKCAVFLFGTLNWGV